MGSVAILCHTTDVRLLCLVIRLCIDCDITSRSTLAAVILDYIGLYCEDSWSPAWGHVYVGITAHSLICALLMSQNFTAYRLDLHLRDHIYVLLTATVFSCIEAAGRTEANPEVVRCQGSW